MRVLLNDRIVPVEAARVSPFDRGLLLGDGVFETVRAYKGRPFDLDRHLARLARSASLTGIPLPDVDLAARIGDLLRENGLLDVDAQIRVTLTAGEGGAGASRRGAGPPTLLVTAKPVSVREAQYAEGIAVVVSTGTRRAPPEVLDPRVKGLTYLPHALARREAEARGADDAILLNLAGEVVEATTANVFAVLDGEVVTPPLSAGCLDGLVRERVLELARKDAFAVAERALLPRDLAAADEIFLTGSVSEVVPVARFEGSPVGAVVPGPVARRLLREYRALATRGG